MADDLRERRIIEAGDAPGAVAHWREHLGEDNRIWLSGYRDALLDGLD